ncbi:Pentatricopeptide repeat-containing protein [Nymphaea thermarum]|nr:Pentatricopeptide repeat-containing protein [Nymphaea thermarum]
MAVCVAGTGDGSPRPYVVWDREFGRRAGLALLKRCRSTKQVKQVHARIIKSGCADDCMLLAKLLQLCVSFGSMRYATLVFDQTPDPDAFVWNVMIRGHTHNGSPMDALFLYNLMLARGVSPDKYTFPFVVKACVVLGSSDKGKEVHARAIKAGFETDTFVQNNLTNLYLSSGDTASAHRLFVDMSHRTVVSWTTMVSGLAKVGDLKTARVLFERMPEKNVVSWSAMINGYARNGQPHRALELFHQMQLANVRPNEFTLVSLLLACAELGSLNLGNWVHDYIQKRGYELTVFLGTALLDMYSKCGSISDAVRVFQKMPEKSVATWNAMITSLGVHGRGKDAIHVFHEMQMEKVRPDDITFIGVLCACLNAGLAEDGCRYLDCMIHEYNIMPTTEHYGYVVDLLCRAGRLDEAHQLVATMPVEPDTTIWKSLHSTCRKHGDAELGQVASKRINSNDAFPGPKIMDPLPASQTQIELEVG